MRAQVFKYQASQFPYHEDVFVYNRTRSIQGQFPMTKELEALFEEHGEKFYAMGKYNPKTGKVMIDAIVPDPGW